MSSEVKTSKTLTGDFTQVLGTILRKLFGSEAENKRYISKNLYPILDAVCGHESRYAAMTDRDLRSQTFLFKERLAQGETLDDLLTEAFAVVREAAKRVVGMRLFDVQILGGIVLHQGNIAEMVTGEGKTLVATLPVYLNALSGVGVHAVTVNDQLARRDSEWMGPIHEFLGLTVGVILHDLDTAERQVAYRADITYGTNNEFGFDYLRDNMAIRPEHRVQRGLNYCIIDEVDSILVDEARTPLIISGRPEKSTDLYYKVDEAIRKLRKEKHFQLEEKGHHVIFTDEGMEMAEKLLGLDSLYTNENLGTVHMIEQALRAHHFFKRDDEYMISDAGEVLIVDEFTGRAMEGRRYSDGLHQAIEAKEGVPVQFESQTVASISYQNYFRIYKKIAGMTGTAATEATEFAKIYSLEVVTVPTNLPLLREDCTDLIFASEKGKYRYVADEVAELHATGRPVLIGTVSIEKSEYVAQTLRERGLEEFQVLNAKHHEREAAIIANAGLHSAITIATNMAGRGTDIKLAEGVAELGGLAVIGTERHESRRIDNQLRGRCGRQGDPGTTNFYVSLEDEVARLFGGDKVKKLLQYVGGEQMDEEPLSQKMVSRSIERAQRQVEEYNYEIRKHMLEYDDVMNKQRTVIYDMRNDVLNDRDVTGRLHDMFANIIDGLIFEFAPQDLQPDDWDLEGLDTGLRSFFIGLDFDISGGAGDEAEELADSLLNQAKAEYERREELILQETLRHFRETGGDDEAAVDFAKIARKRVHDLELMALLRAVDDKWIDHLYSMDYLRDSVRLRAYGQKDPLLEYKSEGFEMFETMLNTIDENVVQTLFRLTDPEVRRTREIQAKRGTLTAQEDPFSQLSRYTYVAAEKQEDRSFASYDTSRFALAGQHDAAGNQAPAAQQERPKLKPRRVGPKVGPNDKCPCASGKKYKKCCGKQVDM